jgi:hypothetical protein
MAVYHFTANDNPFGEYRAETEEQARDMYADDLGYGTWAEMFAEEHLKGTESGIDVLEIDTKALCAAVTDATGHLVFEDSYGDGVALVNNVSYATYQDLAESIGKNCWDFAR